MSTYMPIRHREVRNVGFTLQGVIGQFARQWGTGQQQTDHFTVTVHLPPPGNG